MPEMDRLGAIVVVLVVVMALCESLFGRVSCSIIEAVLNCLTQLKFG